MLMYKFWVMEIFDMGKITNGVLELEGYITNVTPTILVAFLYFQGVKDDARPFNSKSLIQRACI